MLDKKEKENREKKLECSSHKLKIKLFKKNPNRTHQLRMKTEQI